MAGNKNTGTKSTYFVPATLQNLLSLISMRIPHGGFFHYTVTKMKRLRLEQVINLGNVAQPVLGGTRI